MVPVSHPSGSTAAPAGSNLWLESLLSEARAHRAVQHPFLRALADGAFGVRTHAAARALGHAYAGYSQWFPRYLRALIARMPAEDYRDLLRRNLDEEQGHLDPADREVLASMGIDPCDVEGVPHPELFRRFCVAIGLAEADLAQPPLPTIEWRAGFLGAMRAGTPAFGVGALGLGTESIVATVYTLVIRGLERVEGLSRRDRIFFDLHCYVDDQHQKDLLAIAQELAQEPAGAAEVEHGLRLALALREEFFDALHESCLPHPELLDAPPTTTDADEVPRD
ncbi:MAG: iron-containing redox enzyme family protein [Planctomycetota bacterium]